MRISNEEKKFIESISNIAGVTREDTEKVFEAFVLHVVLELYDRIEKYFDDDAFIEEEINVGIPYFFENVKLKIKEKEGIGGICFNIFTEIKPSEYLLHNIKQVLNNEVTEIQKKIKIEIFKGIDNIAK